MKGKIIKSQKKIKKKKFPNRKMMSHEN